MEAGWSFTKKYVNDSATPLRLRILSTSSPVLQVSLISRSCKSSSEVQSRPKGYQHLCFRTIDQCIDESTTEFTTSQTHYRTVHLCARKEWPFSISLSHPFQCVFRCRWIGCIAGFQVECRFSDILLELEYWQAWPILPSYLNSLSILCNRRNTARAVVELM